MEQLIFDFLSKSCELILFSRLRDKRSKEALKQPTNPKNSTQFQLKFPQLFNFDSKVPPEWVSSDHRVLVLEFYLKRNNSSKEQAYSFPPKKSEPKDDSNVETYLVEQWCFELSEPQDHKRKYTVSSYDSLYTKLAILMRSLSTLSATVPLSRAFLNDSFSVLHQNYSMDYSIKFNFRLLSSWHPTVHEESLLANYTNQDLVLPGTILSFKVNYTKDLKFLQKFVESPARSLGFNRVSSNDKLEALEYINKRERFLSDDIDIKEPRRARNNANRNSQGHIDMSQKMNHKFSPRDRSESMGLAQWGSKEVSEGNFSPIDSIFGTNSPIETQKASKIPSWHQVTVCHVFLFVLLR